MNTTGCITALAISAGMGILAKVSYGCGNTYGTVSAMILVGLSAMFAFAAIPYLIEQPDDRK